MENKDPLYCIVFTVLDNKRQPIKTEFEYTHAPDKVTAEARFRSAHSVALVRRRLVVVDVAPAIGFIALDDNGDKCLA